MIAAGYFLLAVFSILTTRLDGGLAFLWVATGMLIAVLKRLPQREWRRVVALCALASAAATATVGAGPVLALPLAAANMAEAVVGAYLMSRLHTSQRPLGSMGWTVSLLIVAGLIAPFVMASISALPMWIVFDHAATFTFERVLLGHGLSNIICVPIFALFGAGWRDMRRDRRLPAIKRAELLFLFAAQLAVNFAVFGQSDAPLLFLAVLPTVIIAFRCASRAVAVSLVILALISGYATLRGLGPIHLFDASVGQRMQLLCFYLVTIVLTIMPIAAGLRGRAHLLRRVSDSEQRYRMLADHSGDIIMHSDADGTIRFVSPSIERVGGYRPADLVGTNCMAIIHPASHAHVQAHYQFALANDPDTRFEYRAIRRDGRWGWFESDCRGVTDHSGARGVVSVVRDISDRKAREDQLATAALTDSLTGLPNRRAFREAAGQIVNDQRVRTAAIAILDIDHFKSINDTYGHDAGDEVLQGFAAVAQRLRRKDDMMARLGGEEFAILLPDTSVAAAVKLCERLRAEIADSVCVTMKGPIRITVSGGVSTLSRDGLDESLRRADEALYRAKRQGRDRLLQAAAA